MSGIDLHVGRDIVARYERGDDLDPGLSPRPYLHPVTTLAGHVVSAFQPADHPWHLGASVAVQDVGGANLWGGPTYVDGLGYVDRSDHGRIVHTGWDRQAPDGVHQRLEWQGPAGTLLTERRRIAARRRTPRSWELTFAFTLRNPGRVPISLGSPATNGRIGAGYGGFFWRMPESASPPRVFTAQAEGEAAVHGSRTPWLAFSADAGQPEAPYTLIFTLSEVGDPWFVRGSDYNGVCSALAFSHRLALLPGTSLLRRIRVIVCDGKVEPAQVSTL